MDEKPHTSKALLTVKEEPNDVIEEPDVKEETDVKEEPDVTETSVKQVKRRGRPKRIHKQTPFCPPFMVRCNVDRQHFDYDIMWGCRICNKMLLSKDAAKNHAAICKPVITKEEDIPIADLK